MSIIEDLQQNFGGRDLPTEMVQLLAFEQAELPLNHTYAHGFEVLDRPVQEMFRTYSDDDAFLSRLIEFAEADVSGSIYAFWLDEAGSQSLSEVPIVIFGSEGGYHVVAENIRELLHLLSFDLEPLVEWEQVSYGEDEGATRPSKGHQAYQNWLQKHFGPLPEGDAGTIVKKAQKKYRKAFKDWIGRYFDEA